MPDLGKTTRDPDALRHVTSDDMLEELAARGVIRAIGSTQYLPGIVQARYAAESTGNTGGVNPALVHARANTVRHLTRELLASGAVHVLESRATERGHPDAPPNDLIVESGVLVVCSEPEKA